MNVFLVLLLISIVNAQLDSSCKQFNLSVSLTPVTAADNYIIGWTCGNIKSSKPALLCLHGGTYDARYFDWPQQWPSYSFVHYAINHGYLVINFDRLGNHYSSHPSPFVLSFDVSAYVIHQLVTALKNGEINGVKGVSDMVLVGHSMGSMIGAAAFLNIMMILLDMCKLDLYIFLIQRVLYFSVN